ncbi:hypothetical protein PHISP_07729, partial [Aspergillus sp. HF37]
QDTASERMRKVHNALSAGLKQPREMGMRETDQYISKINKQNFDLKLEVFHRTQQNAGIARKLEHMNELEEELRRLRGLEDELQELRNAEEENQRLRESNDMLYSEIGKRDHAVTEAVELICQLEAKVEELETGHSLSRPSTTRPLTSDGSDVSTPKIGAMIDIPERTSSKRATVISKQSREPSDSPNLERAPSFLRKENKNTAALRALFVPNEAPSTSALSVLTKTESSNSMNAATEAQSPRISALSECSELDPYDSPTRSSGLDQLDIPIRKAPTDRWPSSRLDKEEDESQNDRASSWMQPQADISPMKLPKQKNRATTDFYRAADTPSLESDLQLGSQPQKTPLATAFGDSRLPPTPDTMIVRPHSADELQAIRNASNSALPDSMDANESDATPFGLKGDDKDETPAIFPLHGLSSKSSGLFSPGISDIPSFGYYGGAAALDEREEGSISRRQSMSDSSYSPTLAAYDWVEAAKAGPRSKKETAGRIDSHDMRGGTSSMNLGLIGTRTPSQSSSAARRHSLGSTVRDYEPSEVPTLDLSSLEPNPRARPVRESRRRISLRPPFFGRSIMSPRRFQSSGMCDVAEPDDGAPSPVIRKTRQASRTQPKMEPDADRMDSGQDDFGMFSAPYAENGDNLRKTLLHSSTESNIASNGAAARPSTANGKEHKRRNSIGIIGWMKGASGIGSHKKAEPRSPAITMRPSTVMLKEKAPVGVGSEGPGTVPEPSGRLTPAAATADNPDAADTPRDGGRMDDPDQRRRPRYIERRPRRA